MCTLCVEVQKKRMTIREVARAFREFELPKDHLGEIMVAIEENYGVEPVAKELSKLYDEEIRGIK